MAAQNPKNLNQYKADVAETRRHNIGVMMPFIKFSWGAMKLIGRTLVGIIKLVPKPDDKPEEKTGNRVIKIK